RIAVHPDYLSMGYGTKALELLEKLFKNGMSNSDNNNNLSCKKELNSEVLLYSPEEIIINQMEWMGMCISLNISQLKFGLKNKFRPINLEQNINLITGEYEMTMLKPINNDNMSDLYADFKCNLILLLSYNFKYLHHSITLRLLDKQITNDESFKAQISNNKLKRLEFYIQNILDFYSVVDVIFLLAEYYFIGLIDADLSILEKAVLLMVGLQRRLIYDVAEELKISEKDCLKIIHKIVLKLYNSIK
ncbi:RNA cytidine acetyltransferase, partial [Astathelohania contejeani]